MHVYYHAVKLICVGQLFGFVEEKKGKWMWGKKVEEPQHSMMLPLQIEEQFKEVFIIQ